MINCENMSFLTQCNFISKFLRPPVSKKKCCNNPEILNRRLGNGTSPTSRLSEPNFVNYPLHNFTITKFQVLTLSCNVLGQPNARCSEEDAEEENEVSPSPMNSQSLSTPDSSSLPSKPFEPTVTASGNIGPVTLPDVSTNTLENLAKVIMMMISFHFPPLIGGFSCLPGRKDLLQIYNVIVDTNVFVQVFVYFLYPYA